MVVASLSLALALTAPIYQSESELPYAELAERFLQENGQAGLPIEDVTVEAILEESFFSTRVGQFEIWIPTAALQKKDTARDYTDICAGLCKAQNLWMGWLGPQVKGSEQLVEGFDALENWISKWKVTTLTSVAKQEERNALNLFKAKGEVRTNSEHLAQVMRSGSVLGSAIEDFKPVQLILMPKRKEFVEFLTVAGLLLPEQKGTFWVPGIETWTEFRINNAQVIALQHPASTPVPGKYDGSTSMKDREPTGIEQQAVQLGMNRLLAYHHGPSLPDQVIAGLSINMLIELYGSCHTRNDGDMRGRITHARSVFIAGGQSSGGRLPQNVAVSRWRTGYGKSHYMRILKQVQKSGSSGDKRNSHKYNSFLLIADDEASRFITHSPLYGPAERETDPLPEGFSGDYMEFLRAYNVGFMHWLRTAAGGSKKDSSAAFGIFLSQISLANEDQDLAKAAEASYGLPISDPGLTNASLEGRFVKWVSKQ
ncbi:MAG: hypothetical protein ACI8X5_003184 [Planctomycetota bacterium]|jgi:hypothetical protein